MLHIHRWHWRLWVSISRLLLDKGADQQGILLSAVNALAGDRRSRCLELTTILRLHCRLSLLRIASSSSS